MAKKPKPKSKPPNIRFYVGQLSGAEIERRKADRVCLFCLTALTYQFDGDAKTGCLHDFCVNCRNHASTRRHRPPRRRDST